MTGAACLPLTVCAFIYGHCATHNSPRQMNIHKTITHAPHTRLCIPVVCQQCVCVRARAPSTDHNQSLKIAYKHSKLCTLIDFVMIAISRVCVIDATIKMTIKFIFCWNSSAGEVELTYAIAFRHRRRRFNWKSILSLLCGRLRKSIYCPFISESRSLAHPFIFSLTRSLSLSLARSTQAQIRNSIFN